MNGIGTRRSENGMPHELWLLKLILTDENCDVPGVIRFYHSFAGPDGYKACTNKQRRFRPAGLLLSLSSSRKQSAVLFASAHRHFAVGIGKQKTDPLRLPSFVQTLLVDGPFNIIVPPRCQVCDGHY